jgi:pyruvate dehydrogenase phosphatase
VPTARISDARQEVHRKLADATGRNLGIHVHFRWSVLSVCPWAELEVYAGHAGHATVEHAFRTLPSMIKQALESLLRSFRGHGFAAAVSGMLSDCIARFDHSITADFTRMFPGGPAGLQGMSSTQIRHLFQDRMPGPGSQDLTAVARCLQGSTVIMTLTDPSKHNLWIANLGDSRAGVLASIRSSPVVLISRHLVLGSRTHAGDWSATFVTAPHDGNNPSEVRRIQNQHPGEPECMKDNRVVGFLAPTRCEHYVCIGNPHSS